MQKQHKETVGTLLGETARLSQVLFQCVVMVMLIPCQLNDMQLP